MRMCDGGVNLPAVEGAVSHPVSIDVTRNIMPCAMLPVTRLTASYGPNGERTFAA